MKLQMEFILLIFSVFIRNVLGECNACNPASGVACTSETHFKMCEGGVPTRKEYPCPEKSVCTDNMRICLPSTGNTTASCSLKCGLCGKDRRVACIDQTHFALCFGLVTPSSTIGTCPPKTVCNNELEDFCGSPAAIVPDCKETGSSLLGSLIPSPLEVPTYGQTVLSPTPPPAMTQMPPYPQKYAESNPSSGAIFNNQHAHCFCVNY